MKKPLKVAAWSGIIAVAVSFLLTVFNEILVFSNASEFLIAFFSFFSSVIFYVSSILFSYGFIVLGKRYNGTLLQVMSWISIISIVILLFFSIVGNIMLLIPSVNAQAIDGSLIGEESFDEFSEALLVFFLVMYVIISILIGTLMILFGVGLLKIKSKVEYAETAGVLNIVAGATLVIFIGWFVAIAAYIVEIILLFKASKKLEKR